MIELDNQTDLNIDLEKLENIAKSLSKRSIELILTDEKSIQSINQSYRGKNTSTDVLSFPIKTADKHLYHIPLGSIIICDSFVIDNAKYYKHSIQDECSLLFIHGILHLLGFDHETDHGEMREKEATLIKQFNLAESLIMRTKEQ
ncbi:Metal-dependent hydrolase YbeY, involved in rRNA and/or ribosome maturation and assembly [hydrothermal vent metagenome]|uniref:Metal-dependent hydrolase YbeY, involved in rRNA and/or ribosome maturation and assembly n=1 Tax=hydrothermal vent metagenome TaxID=652676 RepID=A0A1W1CZT7_9ZZZZ